MNKKTPLTPKQIEREITRRNNIFAAKSKKEKRQLIAADVLEQLRSKFVIARNGFFFKNNFIEKQYNTLPENSWDSKLTGEQNKRLENKDIRTLLLEANTTCKACAIGSLTISCTLFNNKSKLKNLGDDFLWPEGAIETNTPLTHGLNKFFSRKSLVLIEQTFELGGGMFSSSDIITIEERERCIEFGEKFKNPKDRLTVIMKKIVEEGDFKI